MSASLFSASNNTYPLFREIFHFTEIIFALACQNIQTPYIYPLLTISKSLPIQYISWNQQNFFTQTLH